MSLELGVDAIKRRWCLDCLDVLRHSCLSGKREQNRWVALSHGQLTNVEAAKRRFGFGSHGQLTNVEAAKRRLGFGSHGQLTNVEAAKDVEDAIDDIK
jgi:hypothetical protein